MFVVGLGVDAYELYKGDVLKDKRGMHQAREQGRRVAIISELRFKFPESFNSSIYRAYIKLP